MLRSLFSGISGLRAHQQMMDVTGNNIANVNTAGFKASKTTFEDTLSQMIKAAGAAQNDNGGTNPSQVGLGVRLAAIQTNFSQGAAQNTGRSTDLMISGDGFFAVRNGGETLYTRNGSFSPDATGKLVTTEGYSVRGWLGANGVVNSTGAVQDVVLPLGSTLPPVTTSTATIAGNLPGEAAVGASIVTSITGYDAQGNEKLLSATFTKQAGSPPTWAVVLSDGVAAPSGAANMVFAVNGSTPSPSTMSHAGVTFDLAGVTGYAGTSTIKASEQNGSAVGSLQSFTISPDGTVVGVFSNGLKQSLAQIALASFNNPPGLEKVGGSLFRSTVNSGNAAVGAAGGGGRGMLQGGTLEMSNVDLGEEFTNLIIAQRGFQANSKVISTSDELLQDLVNLKR